MISRRQLLRVKAFSKEKRNWKNFERIDVLFFVSRATDYVSLSDIIPRPKQQLLQRLLNWPEWHRTPNNRVWFVIYLTIHTSIDMFK